MILYTFSCLYTIDKAQQYLYWEPESLHIDAKTSSERAFLAIDILQSPESKMQLIDLTQKLITEIQDAAFSSIKILKDIHRRGKNCLIKEGDLPQLAKLC